MSQRESDARLRSTSDDFTRDIMPLLERRLARMNTQQRLHVVDLLGDFARNDDTISQARINSLMRELDDLEAQNFTEMESGMRDVVQRGASFGVAAASAAAMLMLGRAVALSGRQKTLIANETVRTVFEAVGPDNLRLSDRVWQLTADQRDEIARVIRRDVRQGASINRMIRDVKRVYDNDTWKVERLVRTESQKALRTGQRLAGSRLDGVVAVQIHRGIADRPEHRCTQLELADSYGLGAGIYPLNSGEVDNPHPNCTSYLTYVYERSDRD